MANDVREQPVEVLLMQYLPDIEAASRYVIDKLVPALWREIDNAIEVRSKTLNWANDTNPRTKQIRLAPTEWISSVENGENSDKDYWFEITDVLGPEKNCGSVPRIKFYRCR